MDMEINITSVATVNIYVLLLAIVKLLIVKRKKESRRWWVQPHLAVEMRSRYGAHSIVFSYFKLNNHEEFYKFTRMSVQQFVYLLDILEPKLIKFSKFRKPLSPELKLAAVLNYLGHGKSVQSSAWYFRIGVSTMYQIIPEVCSAIYMTLKKKYIKFPNHQAEWTDIAANMDEKYNMPNCLGALDGKHFRIEAPAHSGSRFHNFKNFKSVVLLATCDAYKRFTWVNVGDFGSLNDAGCFNHSDLGRMLMQEKVALPDAKNLPNSSIRCPYFFVGDSGFPLKSHLLTPFARRTKLSFSEHIFNARLSKARKIIECAFGWLVKKWRILLGPMATSLETTEDIILAGVCLHNFLITYELENGDNVIDNDEESDSDSSDDEDMDDEYQDEPAGEEVRATLKSYFVSPAGSVPWQYECI